MAAGFIVLLRESLEAALLVAIVAGYLKRSGSEGGTGLLASAVAAGLIASVLAAVVFERLAGGFEGRGEQLFEGITMLAGAALLTTMIVWITRRSSVERSVERSLSRTGRWGLFFIVFVSVLREGIESVIFVAAAAGSSQGSIVLGAALGVAAAALLAVLFIRGSSRVGLRRFFGVTNLLLILFAAGLVARGVHELQEAGVLPVLIEHLWNLNPAVRADGSYAALHEDGLVGSFAKSLVGYDGDPSLLEAAAYVVYLAGTVLLWRDVSARRRASGAPPRIDAAVRASV